jgi:hypothetical protein
MADFKTLFGVGGVRAADPPRSVGVRCCCIWRREGTRRIVWNGIRVVDRLPRIRRGGGEVPLAGRQAFQVAGDTH